MNWIAETTNAAKDYPFAGDAHRVPSPLKGERAGVKDERGLLISILATALLFLTSTAYGFPPAPHHTLFGTVRNQWGDPINVSGADVFIQTTNAIGVAVRVTASTAPGVNYEMQVPMDSGRTLDIYQSTAIRQGQPFQLKVKIGAITYVPIEMVLTSRALGQPAGATRLDLTLGVDSDGDGLPDAWEQALIDILGGNLAGITPEGDADGDGISNLHEFLAGTYAFDPNDGFRLALTGLNAGGATLDFFTVRGRTYRLQGSSDLRQWTPLSFRVVNGGTAGPLQSDYPASDYRQLRVEIPFQPGTETNLYFRALVQ